MLAGQTKWINVPFSIQQRPYLKRVLRGIEAYGRKAGDWRIQLPNYFQMTRMNFPTEQKRRLSGQIAGVPAPHFLEMIFEKGLPTVLINGPKPIPDWAVNVELDFEELAKLSVEHFTSQGIERLAFFGSTHPDRTEHHCYQAHVIDQCRSKGIGVNIFDEVPPGRNWTDLTSMLKQWREWIQQLPEGTGIICADDEQAARLYLAASGTDIKIGESVFLLGLWNEETFCEAMVPPLSSIQLDYFRLGWEAAKALDRLIHGENLNGETITVSYAFIISRQSSRLKSSRQELVQLAIDYIWKELGNGVTVDSVSSALKVNTRQLHRLFIKEVGRTPMAEIQLARVETAKRLLCESTESVASIAATCGFSDQAHLSRAIKKATGDTPSQFRLIARNG